MGATLECPGRSEICWNDDDNDDDDDENDDENDNINVSDNDTRMMVEMSEVEAKCQSRVGKAERTRELRC